MPGPGHDVVALVDDGEGDTAQSIEAIHQGLDHRHLHRRIQVLGISGGDDAEPDTFGGERLAGLLDQFLAMDEDDYAPAVLDRPTGGEAEENGFAGAGRRGVTNPPEAFLE